MKNTHTKLNCVLLIDDDETNNFLNKLVIRESGVAERVEIALNGKEAIEFLTKKGKYPDSNLEVYPQPALIFLDINMPVMDGWDFLEEYQKLPEDQKGQIVIVMLTTSFNPDDKVKAEQITEISDFKNKPLTIEVVKDVVRKYFPQIKI